MGLSARRAMQELQDVTVPEKTKEIEEICGAPIPLEIDWKSFGQDVEAMHWLRGEITDRIKVALRRVCADDLGKEAVREGLKKIRIGNVGTVAEKRLSCHDGVLEMYGAYIQEAHWSNDGTFGEGDIVRALDEAL